MFLQALDLDLDLDFVGLKGVQGYEVQPIVIILALFHLKPGYNKDNTGYSLVE